jgi:hypothetical protein
MEVKSVQPGEAVSPGFSQETPQAREARRPAKSDNTPQNDPYSLELSRNHYVERTAQNSDRISLNNTIDAVQLALHSVSSMEELVNSVDGLASVAQSGPGSERTLQVLERESASLVQAMREVAASSTRSGLHPLAGDPIRLELERTFGPVLEVVLPDERKDPLGLTNVSFASRDLILSTFTKIEHARERLKGLRSAVTDGLEQLATATQAQRTSFAPSSNRGVQLNSVDEAQTASWGVREQVLADPENADRVHNVLTENAFTLLRTQQNQKLTTG